MGGGKLKKTAMVQFAWRAIARDFDEEQTVEVWCDNAGARGVPLPDQLKNPYCRHRLEKAAKNSMKDAQVLFGEDVELTCRWA